MTRIGLIGCGMWGRNLARNLAALGVLAGVADRYPDRAGDFAGEFGTSHVPVDELLAGHDLDGVVIASATPTHAELACQALECGLHTYVENPFALTLIVEETAEDTWRGYGGIGAATIPPATSDDGNEALCRSQ